MDYSDENIKTTDSELKHCITCEHASKYIDEEPCVQCLNTDPVGRLRLLWIRKNNE